MKSRKVLIAEDEEDVQNMIRCVLEARGYEVLATDNGVQALEIAQTESPDLILTDILMPGITGLELCRQLREHEACASIPVVVITSVTQDSDLADGFWRMATDSDLFVTKPFNPFELADKIAKLIAERRADKEETPS